jgi:hypothetical protein
MPNNATSLSAEPKPPPPSGRLALLDAVAAMDVPYVERPAGPVSVVVHGDIARA